MGGVAPEAQNSSPLASRFSHSGSDCKLYNLLIHETNVSLSLSFHEISKKGLVVILLRRKVTNLQPSLTKVA